MKKPQSLFLLTISLVLLLHFHAVSCIECDYPLKPAPNNKSCVKPCSGTLAWKPQTQSCFPACVSPFVENRVNGVRVCEPLCSEYQFFNHRGNNCTDTCQEPMVEAKTDGSRVCKMPCSPGKAYRQSDKTCHVHCPSPWKSEMKNGIEVCQKPCDDSQPIWSPSYEMCIKACDAPAILETIDGIQTCRHPCAAPEEFWNNETHQCMKNCPGIWISFDSAWDQVIGKTCAKPCKDDEYYIDYDSACVKECPKPLLPQTKEGVKHCAVPCKALEFYNVYTQKCISDCLLPSKPSETYTGPICLSWCQPSDFYVKEYKCFQECPYPQIQEQRAVDGTKFCYPACPENKLWDPEAHQCIDGCTELRVYREVNNTKMCVRPCPEGQVFIPALDWSENKCLPECPAYLKRYTVDSVETCLNPCREGEAWSEETLSCTTKCFFPKYALNKKIILSEKRSTESRQELEVLICENHCNPGSEQPFWVPKTQSCEKECPQDQLPHSIGNLKFCKPACPSHQFFNTRNSTCQDGCLWPWNVQGGQTLHLCVEPCENGNAKNNFPAPGPACVPECVYPSVLEIVDSIKICQKPCNSRLVWDNATKSCQVACSFPLVPVKINGIDSCAPVCSTDQYFLVDFPEYVDSPPKCVSSCPEPYIADSSNGFKSCRRPCLEREVYDFETQSCLARCPYLRQQKDTNDVQTCGQICPENQFFHGKGEIFKGYYSQGKCLNECPAPYLPTVEAGVNVCRPPCESELLWIPTIEKCVASCPKTHIQNSELFPRNTCWPICADWKWTGFNPITGECDCFETQNKINGVQVCRVTCLDKQEYWNEATMTCEKLCPEPFKKGTKNDIRVCSKPCEDSEFYIWETKTCQKSCPESWVLDVIQGIDSCRKL